MSMLLSDMMLFFTRKKLMVKLLLEHHHMKSLENRIKHLDLFSGIGGFAIAVDTVWPGSEHIFCDNDKFCQQVLKKHWPKAKIHGDIKKLKGSEIGPIHIITGGFPCQPFSIAGNRKGKEDDRDLWPEMLRVITELRPAWVLGENVAGFIHLALDECLAGLESQGYACQSFSIPACGINAPHRRDRIFIVARDSYCSIGRKIAEIPQGENSEPAGICGYDVCRIPTWAGGRSGKPTSFIPPSEVEPGIYRMADGIPKRLDRLKCLGNAVVPQQVFPILKAIKDLHDCNIRDASQLINLAI